MRARLVRSGDLLDRVRRLRNGTFDLVLIAVSPILALGYGFLWGDVALAVAWVALGVTALLSVAYRLRIVRLEAEVVVLKALADAYRLQNRLLIETSVASYLKVHPTPPTPPTTSAN